MFSTKSQKKIVFIDDDVIQITLNNRLFELCGLGAEIISFTDPLDAMNFIRNHSNEIDVIFLDLNMPVYNGWKFLELMNEHLIMPVYMLTSSINAQDLSRSGEFSAIKQFISKPLTLEFVNELKAELGK